MSVYNESVVDGKTYPGTAYIEVRRVHSMERVARLVDELAALLDELESQLQQPDSDYAQVLEQLSAIEKQLADMNAVLAALSSPDNPRAEDLQTRIDALEQEVARLAELATPPGTCTLLFPENDSTLTVSQVDLIWNVAARAAEYTLDIRKPDGSQIIETISETRYTLDVASAPGPYAWTVTAVGSASVGGQALTTPCAGGIHTFEIAAPAPTQPPSFYLVSPAAGEASTAGVIAFEWEQVQGLQDYVLEVRMPDGSVREAVGQGGAVTIELGAGDYQWSVRAALAGGGVIGAANGPRALRVVPLPAPTPVPFVFLSPRPSACQVASRPVRFEWGSAGPEMTYDLAVKALATGDIIAATSTAETWAELYLEPGIYSWEVQAHSSDGAVLAMRGSGVRFAVRTECSEGGLGWLLILPLIVIGGLIALRIARTKSKDYWLEEVSEDDMALGNGEHFVITTAAPLNGVRLGMDDVTQDDHPVFDVGAPNALIRRGWFGGFTLQEGATKRSIRLGRSVDVTDINGIKRWVRLQTTEPPSSEEDSVGPLEIPSDADL